MDTVFPLRLDIERQPRSRRTQLVLAGALNYTALQISCPRDLNLRWSVRTTRCSISKGALSDTPLFHSRSAARASRITRIGSQPCQRVSISLCSKCGGCCTRGAKSVSVTFVDLSLQMACMYGIAAGGLRVVSKVMRVRPTAATVCHNLAEPSRARRVLYADDLLMQRPRGWQ
jgi:hypothetical protein